VSDFYDEPSVSGGSIGPTEAVETVETVETMTADLESPPATPLEAPAEPVEAREEPAETETPAVTRFKACRWHETQENAPSYCANRDVLPFAGRNSFNPEAWCPDCKLYKVKRKVKKRSPNEWDNY
jgi:hypothetical protein